MYGILVALHNITRWAVVVAAVYALVVAYRGWFSTQVYSPVGRRAGAIFGAVIGLQFIIGLLVYFWPTGLVMGVLGNAGFGGAMRNDDLRFFVVEHIAAMTAAVVLVHVGSAVARRATSDKNKYRRAAIFYTIASLLVVVSIPWWRPLFPGLG